MLNRLVELTLRAADVRARRDGFSVAAVVRGTEDSEDLEADEVGARKAGTYAVYMVSGCGVWVRRFDSRADAGKPQVAVGTVLVLRRDIGRLSDARRIGDDATEARLRFGICAVATTSGERRQHRQATAL